MPIEYTIRDGMVEAQASGVLDDPTFVRYVERLLRDAEYRPDMPVLFDSKQVTSLELSSGGVRDATTVVRESPDKPTARVAVVVGGPAAYGMARMYGMLRDVEVGVFEDRDRALAWLLSTRAQATGDQR